jgi:hypothetical protein
VVQAAFTITTDVTSPVISQVSTRQDSTKVTVVFDEQVDSLTARTSANYSINKGVSVLSVAMSGNGPSAVLTTSAMQAETTYTLTVNNVKDLSNNTIAPNTKKQFTFYNFDPVMGLTGFWPFNNDQDTVAKDQSGHRSDGIVYGPAWTWAPGKVGQGIQLSAATQRMQIGNAYTSFMIDPTNAFTIALWVKITGHNGTYDEIFGRTNEYGPSPFSIGITSTRHITTTVGSSSLNSSAMLQDSTWYHVALTYRDSSRVLYINGVKDNGGSNIMAEDLYFPSTRRTCLGAGIKEDGSYLANGCMGLVDEVRIYNRALRANDIAYLYADTTVYTTAVKDLTGHFSSNAVPGLLPSPLYNLTILRAHPSLYRLYNLNGRLVALNTAVKSGVYLVVNVRTKQVQKIILLNK